MIMHPVSRAAVVDHTCLDGLPAARKLAAIENKCMGSK